MNPDALWLPLDEDNWERLLCYEGYLCFEVPSDDGVDTRVTISRRSFNQFSDSDDDAIHVVLDEEAMRQLVRGEVARITLSGDEKPAGLVVMVRPPRRDCS